MRARIVVLAAAVALVAAAAQAEDAAVRAVYVPAGVAGRPEAPAWRGLPETTITLMQQQIVPPVGGGSVERVGVRAMHDGEWLAIRLEWADATAEREVGVDTFRDAAAVGFPVREPETPASPFMGDPQHPVVIWQWTADLDASARGAGGFADRYPHTQGVWYFPQDAAVHRQVRAWRGTDPVVEFSATGFGTLTRRSSRNVLGVSRRAQGRWQVVLRRQLATGDPEDTSFRPGETTKLIVAVWNGANQEVNGRKSVTLNWTPLTLDATLAGGQGGR